MKNKMFLSLLIGITSLISCSQSNSNNLERNVYLYYGDFSVQIQKVKLGDKYTAPSEVITEEYNFIGWYLNRACSSIMKASFPMEIKDDVSLFASYKIKQFTFTYDYNGGYYMEKTTTFIQYGDRAEDLTVKAPSGSTFEGWYSEAECTNKFNFKNRIYKNTTVYAKWTTSI